MTLCVISAMVCGEKVTIRYQLLRKTGESPALTRNRIWRNSTRHKSGTYVDIGRRAPRHITHEDLRIVVRSVAARLVTDSTGVRTFAHRVWSTKVFYFAKITTPMKIVRPRTSTYLDRYTQSLRTVRRCVETRTRTTNPMHAGGRSNRAMVHSAFLGDI